MAGQTRQIDTVLTTVPYNSDDLEALRQALGPATFLHFRNDDWDNIERALQTADVAILEGDMDLRLLEAPRLRWVHCDHAGLNKTARPAVVDSDLIVTGSAGRSAPALAQHAFYFALGLTFDTKGLVEMQERQVWRGLAGYDGRVGLWGKTLGIVGFGRTGEEMAALGQAFGMRVLVYRRQDTEQPTNVDRLYSADRGDTVDELLAESDVVMLAVKLSDETYHMIGAPQLKAMKRSAYLVNLARGSVIDEAALVSALESGEIAGAGLDVFEEEPLPAGAPIWTAPNVLITPHATPRMPDKTQRSIDIISENARRYRAGQPMINVLKSSDLYTKDLNAGRSA
jgi:phosphoglycerate dehydrogenase-like enzyme